MNKLKIFPLKNNEEVFSLIFLCLKLDLDYEKETLTEDFNAEFDHNLQPENVTPILLKLCYYNELNFGNILMKFRQLTCRLKSRQKYVCPPVKKCLKCQNSLSSKEVKNAITYTTKVSEVMKFIKTQCSDCCIIYENDRYLIKGEKFFYTQSFSNRLFRFADAYNDQHRDRSVKPLCRKRLIVFDGNQKCRRLRCLAQNDDGFLCDEAPDLENYFCSGHKNFNIKSISGVQP
ncbi:hypothetical protein BpHYR1_024155, partial [Brachionus plicatilis]